VVSTVKLQIYSVLIATLFSLTGLFFIVWKIEPQAASLSLKIIFFAALLIFIWGAITLTGFFIKTKTAKDKNGEASLDHFYSSLFGGLIVTILIFIAIIIKKII
jgi:protein-S-isoprenylcysteine O-methyltransferase Ste14